MQNIFSYDSKLTQLFLYVADLMILNVVYIVCCIPVFTIGAAQAGLCSGLQALREHKGYTLKAFRDGFRSGFGRITAAWSIPSALILLAAYLLIPVMTLGQAGVPGAPTWMLIVALALIALYQTILPIFHARYDCPFGLLLRNALYFVFAEPIRCILATVLVWFPLVLFLVQTNLFMHATPFWFLLYYSTAFMLCNWLMKKPFQQLEERMETEENE